MDGGRKAVGVVGGQRKFAEDRPGGWRGRVVYVRCSKRISLSRPRRTGCCIVPRGTMHAHTASGAEGVLPCRNWMLIPTDVEVRRGADFPNLPKNEEACAVRRHPKQRGIVSCECYLLSYRGKRSINYPAQGNSCNIFPPSERRDLRDDSVDGSPHTAIRPYPNFDPNPGDPGRHVYNRTHAQAFLFQEKCSKWDSNSCPA